MAEIEESLKKRFYKYGKNIDVGYHVSFNKLEKISIGDKVVLVDNAVIACHDKLSNNDKEIIINIHNDVYLGRCSTIEGYNEVEIGEYVIIAPFVFISDNYHNYLDYKLPIRTQGIFKENNKVLIKAGAWIGTQSSILGNITIGFGSVVAANSVVTKDIPNHCVVAGTPSEIIKVCDYRSGEWINVKNKKELLNEILDNRGIFNGYNLMIQRGDENSEVSDLKKSNNEIESLMQDFLNIDTEINDYIDRIKILLEQRSIDSSFTLLCKFVEGVYLLQNRIKHISNIATVDMQTFANVLNKNLNSMIQFYEEKDIMNFFNTFNNSVVTNYFKWRNETLECIKKTLRE